MAKRALKRLRTIAGILIRELRRELPQPCLFEHYQRDFLLYEQVLQQQPKDRNKIYSLHEPQVYCVAKKAVRQAVCDRGYRDKREVNGTRIVLPGKALKQDNRYQRDKKRKQCKRCAAIEPIISHLKADYRMAKNYLKGAIGDHINLLMAACAWNLKQWLLAIFWLFFPCGKYTDHPDFLMKLSTCID